MTATNHALTGAVIGLAIGSPIALPIALLSHYVLDAIPHYHSQKPDEVLLKTKGFRNYLFAEAFICLLIVILLFASHPTNWFLAAVCAFLAAAPDMMSIKRYFSMRTGKKHSPNAYEKFAGGIQWFQRPIGIVVEFAWFIGASSLLVAML